MTGGRVPVATAYRDWAARYDHDVNATRDLDAVMLRAAALPLDGVVVEFGAGTGKNTAYLATCAARVVALDLSPEMLAIARARRLGGHVAFVEHDITRPWPVADASADLVVGNLVLEHVADLVPVFAAARRALRDAGMLYIAELHPYRQLRGSTARYTADDGELRVEAYAHSVADYLSIALAAGFDLRAIAEPAGDGDTVPRLLQLVFAAKSSQPVDAPVF